MKSLFLAAALLTLAAPLHADTPPAESSVVFEGAAVDVGTPVVVDDSAVVTRASLPEGDVVVIKDSLADIVNILTNWRAVSGLALAAALIALLMRLSKLGILYTFLESKGLSWIRPVLAALLGGAGAVVTSLTEGVRSLPLLVIAFVGGVMAGLSAIGGYDLFRLASPVERSKKRVDAATIATSNAVLAEKVVENAKLSREETAPVRAAVAAAEKLPAHKANVALANLLNTGGAK